MYPLPDWPALCGVESKCPLPLQALCAEASLAALRRVYPQIYASDVKLLIDPSAVRVTKQDFMLAMRGELTSSSSRLCVAYLPAGMTT